VTSYTEPKADTVFFVFEKVAVTNGWTKLAQTVDLVNFSNATELITEDDGSTHTEIVGGINASAVVEEIQGSGGGYRITFPHGVDLAPHSDPAVTWNKGSARFTVAAAPHLKRQLPVVAIEQTIPIKIVVFDPEYLASPANRIQVGPTVPVNFHPSYRVYLSPQAGVFDKTKVLPQGTQNNRKTYLAARSADTTIPFYSPLTPPSILVAKNIQKPLAPDSVQGPRFATRPDFYGKATYTFDVPLNTANRTPFGLVVYRANEMAILQALYKPVTMGQVMADLESIAGNDPLRFNRWRSLIECEVDPDDNNRFKPFDNYRFPNPDNESTEVFASASTSVHPFPLPAGETLLSKKAIILKVIEDAFMPLTETPLVFEYLKTGYQTSPTPPTTRSVIGRLLHATDASFDPFPMAVKFPQGNPHTVRFTDYSLNGNSRNIYFYFAREVSVTARYSDRTPVSEAVVLVDAAPAEKPVVRRVATREANPVSNQGPAIEFDLGEYLDSENIRQYQIFRTTEAAAASSVRSMTLAATIDAGNSVEDVFSDLAYPPYSEPLFYRIVALREIVNEQGALEMIPSQPSEILLTNVIDSLNPEAPEIVPTIGGTVTNSNGRVTALTNVSLSWPQSVYNGTYHLYKMNSKGNWERLWSKKTNDGQISFPENGDFAAWPQTANLQTLDGEGNPIYHRFKVSVENANGLFNVDEKELILPVENAISSTEFVTGITSVGVVRNDFENWVGFAFNVSFPLTVNCLGRFKLTGNSQTHEVRIIRESDGVVMCSALVDMSTGPVGQFVYATCIPTTLTAGVTYYCVSFEYNNGDYWYDNNGTSMNVQAIGGLLGSVYFQNSWIYNGNQTYVPPGFMYQ
ncbi:MAG TPA: hypothetical protein VMR70_18885, partial [Flavisolibacter sp.]|nr:hypothetical protein [Flavisolibacter sp.]